MEQNKAKINEEVQKIKSKVQKVIDFDKIEELLMNNKVEFDYDKVKYKVVRPSFKQKQEVNEKRIEKYTLLLQNEKFLLEEDLIKLYKKRGIDIEAMNKNYDALEEQKSKLLFELGKAIKEKKPEKDLQPYRDEISKLNTQQEEIVMRKAVLLDSSIECQVNVYSYSYLAYLITEKSVNNKWIKAWDTYDSFLNSEETLITTVVMHASLLTKNEIPIF